MRTTTRLMQIAVTLALLASEAYAGFMDNYSKWREASQGVKTGYVEALLDHTTSVGKPDDAYFMADRDGLIGCSQAMDITAGLLIEAVDKYYEQDTRSWSEPPSGAFYNAVVFGVCDKYVVTARQKRGLDQVKH